MNTLTTTLLVLCAGAGSLLAQQKEKVQALLTINGKITSAYIADGNSETIRFTDDKKSVNYKDVRISSLETVYFLEPADYTEAMGLYRSRDYTAARTKFAEVAEHYEFLQTIPGNFSTLGAFYQMECCRKLEDLDTLMKLRENFLAEPLLRETDKQQVETYKYWDAVREKSWKRLVQFGESEKDSQVTGSLRAQMSYCIGRAYEGLQETRNALTAYNGGFVSDFAASEVVARNSARNSLRLLKNDKDVQQAIKLFGTKNDEPGSEGSQLLKEGVALAKLWDVALGGGEKLPSEYKMFLEYERDKGDK